MISLQGRSLLQYRCRFEISQDQSLHEYLSQDQSLHQLLSQDQSLLSQGLPREPELDLSDFRVQSHQSPA